MQGTSPFIRVCLSHVNLLVSWFNKMLDRLFIRTKDPMVGAADALGTPWSWYALIYAFLQLKLLPRLLWRINSEGISAIILALDWPWGVWHPDLVWRLATTLCSLPYWPELLSQGPIFHPVSLDLLAWLFKPRFCKFFFFFIHLSWLHLKACNSTSSKVLHGK